MVSALPLMIDGYLCCFWWSLFSCNRGGCWLKYIYSEAKTLVKFIFGFTTSSSPAVLADMALNALNTLPQKGSKS
jgi:hypothetical protein